MSKVTLSLVMYVMCIACSTGCAAWTDKSKGKGSMWSSMQFWKKPYQKPSKLAAIWTHDILAMSGKPPTRGFGGRLYFYNEKSQTIPVDGELVVHGYEEVRIGLSLQTEKTKADKTFMFTAEQFTEHFGSSDLGASYSIWIPWDAADGVQKEITLIPTFKGKDGTILQGEPAKLVLPGRKLEDPLANAAIQHVSIQQSQTPTNMGPLQQLSGMRTTTISVPGQINRSSDRTTNLANNASSVVVHDSNNYGQASVGQNYNAPQAGSAAGNLMYAGSPQAVRANAMLAAYAAQSNANPATTNPMVSSQPLPNSYQLINGVPYASSMPNAVPGGMPQQQVPMQSSMPNAGFTNAGFTNSGMPNNVIPNHGMPSNTMPATNVPAGHMPNALTPSIPGQQAPFQHVPMQAVPMQPGINQNLNPVSNNLNPGFASYAPLKEGAVEAAFASTPQFQPLGQSRMNGSQVQPAAFQSMPGSTSGLGQAQFPGQPAQPMFQR